MKLSLSLFIVGALLLAFAAADCPNSCSYNGQCGEYDKCACDPDRGATDCSERFCPYGVAPASGAYEECSGRGSCDRQTGTCSCSAGFTGAGCVRQECPSGCSGHGLCVTSSELVGDTGDKFGSLHRGCSCDRGYSGASCSQRRCPMGDDPLTRVTYDTTLEKSLLQSAEVQTIALNRTDGSSFASTDEITLSYIDDMGKDWSTHKIAIASFTSGEVQRALTSLPNSVIPSVAVIKNKEAGFQVIVTFSDSANSGDQNMLRVNTAGCQYNGCQPYYNGIQSTSSWAVTYTETTKGTTEHAECSNRGICDRSTGLCKCHAGSTGEACQVQTTFV